jgi:tRNA threonylcarbamoyladenosine biosynthesis protein TsaE
MEIQYSLQEVDKVAAYLEQLTLKYKILTFTAPLGAGKTTLIRALLQRLGVTEPITSPTFSYVNIYHTPQGKTIYHFDVYRLASLQDFIEAGFHEYLYEPNSICLIEWPELVMPLLDHCVCHCTIEYINEKKRYFTSTCIQ